MKAPAIAVILLSILVSDFARGTDANVLFSGERRRNNLVSELLHVSSISNPNNSFTITRSDAGWIFISASCKGQGKVKIVLGSGPKGDAVIVHEAGGATTDEAMRYMAQGAHQIRVECDGDASIDKLLVSAIPDLIHCGLGFNSAIKSYGLYDMDFLKKDILPNVTTLIVPHNIELPPAVIDDWHRQGKKFVAEVGVNAQAKTADEHFQFWTGFLDKAPFLDGIIINEFGMNNPSPRPSAGAARAGTKAHTSRMKRPSEECVPMSDIETSCCTPILAAAEKK